jgi:serine phosphatase RsbU (regulator of sigma subunit)
MQILHKIEKAWNAIRWKMLIIFVFFSVISTGLVGCFSVAVLNVVIRRECAYLIEERINAIVEGRKGLIELLVERVGGRDAQISNVSQFADRTREWNAMWPGIQSVVIVAPKGGTNGAGPAGLNTDTFTGIVADGNQMEIRFLRTVHRERFCATIVLRMPLTESVLAQLAKSAGLEVAVSTPVMLRPYRAEEGIGAEIAANFIPGSRRPVPVVVVARNWKTGHMESWAVCQVRPSYSKTIEDLSRMGLRTASWVSPLAGIAVAFALVYAAGLLLAFRLSKRIVSVIDGLSHAALRVGKGDFSISLPVAERDQLGTLAASFNKMTQDLEDLREQERQRAVLERDIALAHEAQQYLYPRAAPVLSGANVWGVAAPARIVSGDLYDFFSFSNSEVGLLCADVSGKGMPAALMMAHLQAVTHGRLLDLDNSVVRPSPEALVTALNRDLRGRFGSHRYATMFYGEFDSTKKILRYVNAGHCPPILISEAGEAMTLKEGDLPVGLFPGIEYQELQVNLPSGSSIVVFSDGVPDALNSHGEEFGEERIISCCTSLPKGAGAEAICMRLFNQVAEWAAGVDQFDDTTILVVSVD